MNRPAYRRRWQNCVEPARTRIARRPPNIGIVIASSTSRDGSADRLVAVQPHQRERIVGIVDGGGNQRVGAFAHEAGVGTVEQDDGATGIGPGEKGVDFFSAERDQLRSGAGDEERRQPGLDVFRDLLGGAILGVAEGALAGEALQIARECRRTRGRK